MLPVENSNRKAIGKISKAHGIKGEIRIQLDFAFSFPETLPEVFYIDAGSLEPLPYFVEKIERSDEQSAIVKFEGISDRATAEKLRSRKIYVEDAVIATFEKSSPESPFSGIEGFDVLDEAGNVIGNILELNWLPAHPVAVLDEEAYRILPLHEDLLILIDRDKRQIILRLPDGILDL